MQVTTIGLDIAKNVFQVHGVDEVGAAVLRRKLRRGAVLGFFAGLEPCLVGIEASCGAHHWARELGALGHEVRLLPPSYVKPYLKRAKKNDAADAEAICEAMTRPSMRFVPVKSAEQQAALVAHRVREALVRQRTMLINLLRSQMAEFGLIAAQGRHKSRALIALLEREDTPVPAPARAMLLELVAALAALEPRIAETERAMRSAVRQSPMAQALMTIPGIGPITASALLATVSDPGRFRSARHFAAWLGLVARQNSSGGKPRLGRISKMGDRYLRKLLVLGATSCLRRARREQTPLAAWTRRLLERRPPRLVSVALANKTARIVWAVMTRGELYRPEAAAAA